MTALLAKLSVVVVLLVPWRGCMGLPSDGTDGGGDTGLGNSGAGIVLVAAAGAESGEEGVDDARLADIGVTNDTDRDGTLEVARGGIRLERVE